MSKTETFGTGHFVTRMLIPVLTAVVIWGTVGNHGIRAFASEATTEALSESFKYDEQPMYDEQAMQEALDEAEQEMLSTNTFFSLMEIDLRFTRILDFIGQETGIELPKEDLAQDAFGFVDRTAQEVKTILNSFGETTELLDKELAVWEEAKPAIRDHLLDKATESVWEEDSESEEESEIEEDDAYEMFLAYAAINHPMWEAASDMFDRMPLEDKMNYLDQALAVYDAAWEACGRTVADVTGLGNTFEKLGIDTKQISDIADRAVGIWQQIKAGLESGFDADRSDLYLRMEQIKTRSNTLLSLLTPVCNVLDEFS